MLDAANREPHVANRAAPAASNRDSRLTIHGTILAFDFGERYLGVAVGDTVTRIAHPLETIDAEARAARFAAIAKLVTEWQPVRLVVGLPLSLDGEEHELTRRARRFARQLEGRFSLPVALADERLSSADAAARLREAGRGGRRDKDLVHPVAAQIILQAHLDESPSA
jgi:putative Holliday junction resolvase